MERQALQSRLKAALQMHMLPRTSILPLSPLDKTITALDTLLEVRLGACEHVHLDSACFADCRWQVRFLPSGMLPFPLHSRQPAPSKISCNVLTCSRMHCACMPSKLRAHHIIELCIKPHASRVPHAASTAFLHIALTLELLCLSFQMLSRSIWLL